MLPRLDAVEMAYKTSDRFGADQEGEPYMRYVQAAGADIIGVSYDDSHDEGRRIPLGTLELALIDLYEVGGELWEVLDSHSSEWTRYAELEEIIEEEFPHHL